ncbi:MAG: accessory Sec system glycosylation chaperone GtfB, partial [Candidatus Weimeria sp.]
MNSGKNGVLILDSFDEPARLLTDSFTAAGFTGEIICVNDNGFLPDRVTSMFRWFADDMSSGKNTDVSGRPRFFDQIDIPDYWEITASNAGGEIRDLNRLRGRIFFQGSEARLVSEVDWLNETGQVRCTDHYDSHGRLYSRTVFNKSGQKFCRTWFDSDGRERVTENFVTKDILVESHGKTRLYKNRTELLTEMIRRSGWEGGRIFYNSLSVPLFASEKLSCGENRNVLFWQEGPRNDIPGNMQLILENRTQTSEILVQDRASYRGL